MSIRNRTYHNSEVSHSATQFHKTSTPKSPKVYLGLTWSLVLDCHQSPTRQLHFDSPRSEPPLSVDGHSPTNALGKNNGTEAQVATVDLSNDLSLGAFPTKVPNDGPQADSSLCEYPEPGYSFCEPCALEYSLSESEQTLSSSDPCIPRNYFIPLNSAHWAVATQHLHVMTVWALIAMDSPVCVIIL